MKSIFHVLLAGGLVAALPFAGVRAQTSTRKPAPRPTGRPAVKPAAKPTVRTVPPPAPASEAEPSLLETALPTTFTSGPFEAGNQVLNLGIGVGSGSNYSRKQTGGTASVSPAINLSYERGLLAIGPGVLGAGAFVGYQGATYNLSGGEQWKYTDVLLAVRGAFHYPVLPELDAYAGLGVGLRYSRAAYEGNTSAPGAGSGAKLAPGIFVGGRYYLLSNFGVFAELGYDQTYLKVGLTGKF